MRNLYIIFILLMPFEIYGNNYQSELDGPELLRTFFTTQQLRYQLDRLRNQGKYTDKVQAASGAIRKSVKIKLQGTVFRGNKTPVIFINNKNTLQSPILNNQIIIDSAATKRKNYKVPVRVNKVHISLKPGQQWDESKKEVQDSYLINSVETVPESAGVSSDEAAGEVNSDKN